MRATSCSLCDPSPCDLRIRSAWVDEAHLASMWSIWAPMDKLDCSTTPNTRKVLTCSAPGTTGPSGLMLDLCRLLVITSSLVSGLSGGCFWQPMQIYWQIQPLPLQYDWIPLKDRYRPHISHSVKGMDRVKVRCIHNI